MISFIKKLPAALQYVCKQGETSYKRHVKIVRPVYAALFGACLFSIWPLSEISSFFELGVQVWGQRVGENEGISDGATPLLTSVLISEARYKKRYGGSSPLDRCKLAEDVEKLLGSDPHRRLVAIDLDVSPALNGPEDFRKDYCQRQLDKLLISNRDYILLIVPFAVKEIEDKKNKALWMVWMCSEGVAFGDPRVNLEYGLVTRELGYFETNFGTMIREKAQANIRTIPGESLYKGQICSEIAGEPEPFKKAERLLAGNDDSQSKYLDELACKSASSVDGCKNRKGRLLPFQHLYAPQPAGIPVCNFSDQANDECISNIEGKVVVLGGDYDFRDKFRTPIGVLAGVLIHAATAKISEDPERFPYYKLWGFLADLFFGGVVASFAHYLWLHWYKARYGQTVFIKIGLDHKTGWLMLPILALFLLLSCCIIAIFSALLFFYGHIWINPSGMIIGATVAGFFSERISVAEAKIDKGSSDVPAIFVRPSLPRRILNFLSCIFPVFIVISGAIILFS